MQEQQNPEMLSEVFKPSLELTKNRSIGTTLKPELSAANELSKTTETPKTQRLDGVSLAQQFADYHLPQNIIESVRKGLIQKPLNWLKMNLFAYDMQLTNDDIDMYMATPPQTQPNETKEGGKLRRKFAKALLKYRQYIYDYSVYPLKDKLWLLKDIKRKENKQAA